MSLSSKAREVSLSTIYIPLTEAKPEKLPFLYTPLPEHQDLPKETFERRAK